MCPVQAVKAGGSDPVSNKAFADVIKEAKAYNVPKENIDRAVKRAEASDTADFKEAVYEVRNQIKQISTQHSWFVWPFYFLI